tara:strand:- start:1975 stop:2157 length:183 start_codon:yes stop_codon:yes gene_type:complete
MVKGLDKLKAQTLKNILSGPNNGIAKRRIIKLIKQKKGPSPLSLSRPVLDLFSKPKGRIK